jgi:hypothetical protein
MNPIDILLIVVSIFCFILFAIRSAIALIYLKKGVMVTAMISICEQVTIRKSNRPGKEDVTANKYSYEYKVESGAKYEGEIKGLYSADKFVQGDSISVRYFPQSPDKSRYYPFKDFLQFEGPVLVIGVTTLLIVIVKAFVW